MIDFQYIEMDTDSAYLALSGDKLEDVIKPHMKEEYEKDKYNWFPNETTKELLNFGKVSPTNQINERKVQVSACRAAGARCAPCAAGDARRAGYRCGRRAARCSDCLRCDAMRAGWLHSRGAL